MRIIILFVLLAIFSHAIKAQPLAPIDTSENTGDDAEIALTGQNFHFIKKQRTNETSL